MRRTLLIPIVAGLAGLLLAGDAPGYVLPGPYALARSRDKVGRVWRDLSLQVELDQGGVVSRESWVVTRDGALRLPGVEAEARVGLPSLRRLVAGQGGALLRELGADLSRSSLARLDGRVVIVVGALWGESTLPQLWIDQESFLPVRLLAGERELLLRSGPPSGATPPGLQSVQVLERGRLLWQARILPGEARPRP